MRIIDSLSAEIESRWRTLRLDERRFPEVVMDVLAALRPQDELDPTKIIRWFVECEPAKLPRQVNIEATFGEPPITLYAGPHFYIEALHWLDGTTAVHQHGFSGAFQVIGGSSIHSRFTCEAPEQVNSRLLFGRLHLEHSELLACGDARPILAADGLIHSLFHLDRPSVSMVIRTYSEPAAQPQWNYHWPSVAIDPFYKQEALTRLLQAIGMLWQSEHEDAMALTTRALDSSDLHATWMILERFAHVRPNAAADLDTLIAHATATHGAAVEHFRAALAEQRRQRHITARRRAVRNPDHRFFLATLLNLRDARSILDFIQKRFPGGDPRELVLRWLAELSNSPAVLDEEPSTERSPLRFEFGSGELEIFRLLLAGHSPPDAILQLEAEYDLSDTRADALAIAETLRQSLLFQPLFVA